jgi:hypothetical protein
MPLSPVTLDQLSIEDEASMASIAVYPRLKEVLRRADHRFYVPAGGEVTSWDRAVFLNLTYWGGPQSGDVLCEPSIPADVVAHTAWHHLATHAVSPGEGSDGHRPGARALFFGESIASAFDLYLLGHLLQNAPQSDFVVSQAPIMAEVAENAGLSAREFAALTDGIARDPDRAFEDLRALLLDATTALLAAPSAPAADEALEHFAGHRFFPLLHHYQLSNWILYARAYAGDAGGDEARRVEELDRALRAAPSSLAWLAERWL